MSPPGIYAELLLNIRQVTILVTLPSNCNGTTKLELLSDRKSISVTHDSEHTEIILPHQLADNVILKLPPIPAKELSFRLPFDGNHRRYAETRTGQDELSSWPASSMTPMTQIGCRSCSTSLLMASVKSWKDLPSENWAEMMDFWHCHKPDVESAQPLDPQGVTKGYSASNRLGPAAGVGLVDVTSFLLLRGDLVSIKVCR